MALTLEIHCVKVYTKNALNVLHFTNQHYAFPEVDALDSGLTKPMQDLFEKWNFHDKSFLSTAEQSLDSSFISVETMDFLSIQIQRGKTEFMNDAFVIHAFIHSLASHAVDRMENRKQWHSTFVSVIHNSWLLRKCSGGIDRKTVTRRFFISRIAHYSKFPWKFISSNGKTNTVHRTNSRLNEHFS